MNYSFFIANRYFQTNSSRNFVHIISWISNLGIIVGTASLILLLSVFNGFESIVLSMYNTFDPDLKLSTSSGDVFDPTQIKFKNDIENKLKYKAYVLEENILLRFQNKDYIAKAKGVSKEYLKMTNFDSLLVEGSFINQFDENNVAVLGRGVAYHLSFGNISIFNQLQIIIPSREKKNIIKFIFFF